MKVGAAAFATVWLIPAAASVSAVALFESGATPSMSVVLPIFGGIGASFLVWAIVASLLVWALVALVCSPLAGPERANYRSYSGLVNRIYALRSRQQMVCHSARPERTFLNRVSARAKPEPHAVCSRVCAGLNDLETTLKKNGVVWVLGRGYVAAWQALHRAEELLMEAENEDQLIEDFEHDCLRLDGSAIPHRAHLLKLANSARAILSRERPADTGVGSTEEARKYLKEVRYNINTFRDDLFSGLVELRNRTIAALLMTHLFGFAVLALAILAGGPRPAITAGVFFLLVGATRWPLQPALRAIQGRHRS